MSIKELEDKIKNIEKTLGDQRSFNLDTIGEQIKEINKKINEIYDKFDDLNKEFDSINHDIEELFDLIDYNDKQFDKIIKALEKRGIPKDDLNLIPEELLKRMESDLEKQKLRSRPK